MWQVATEGDKQESDMKTVAQKDCFVWNLGGESQKGAATDKKISLNVFAII